MIDVLCIGNVCYDMSLYMDSYPLENSKIEISRILESGGGPAANAAYLLSRWGVECSLAGLIGDDSYGLRIVEEFKSVHTDMQLLEMRSGYATPFSVILVSSRTGSRTVINRKAGQSALNIRNSKFEGLSPRVLLFDGHEPEASIKAMELFPDAATVLDAGSLREGTEILSKKVDYLVSSERFALTVTGLPDLCSSTNRQKCIEHLKKLNHRQIVVTLGENGLIYDEQGSPRHMPAYPAKALDTTAAGDIFHGSFVYGILRKLSLINTLKLSSMAASLSVRRPGGRQSIPSLEEVEEALEKEGQYA